MPRNQVAHTPVYDFGAPVSGARVKTAATATVTASAQVADGDLVVLDVPAGAYGNAEAIHKTFEFDGNDDIETGNIGVTIGADADASMANLAQAINDEDDLPLSAAAVASVVTLTATAGADGNDIDVDETGATLTVTEFSGGSDAGDRVQVAKFRLKNYQGGPFGGRIEADEADLSVTIQVSEDGVTYADTSVADLAVQAHTHQDVSVNLRPGKDNFVAIAATGGGRGRLLAKGDQLLEIVSV